MPLSSTCRNCGSSKSLKDYAENYCDACTTAIKEAREHAIHENLDVGAATRAALATRAHDIHRNRVNPQYPMTKGDYFAVPPEKNV
jgi:hypothetical protein